MPNYEYKSLHVPGKFRSSEEITKLDKIINESAEEDWELSATTPVANSNWERGNTSAIILTFRREKS